MKKCKTTDISEGSKVLEKEKEHMSFSGAAKFRSVAARKNFSASDTADLQFAFEDLCRRMANPDNSDWDTARRTARYLLHRPRGGVGGDARLRGLRLGRRAARDKVQICNLLMWGSSLSKSWSSTENTIALTSAEADLIAMNTCAQHALDMESIGEDFGMVVKP